MTISYKWLSEYLPVEVEPEKLSHILTSIGLEVEKMEAYGEVKGGLAGLVIGEVLQTEKHPNADKLTLTKVNIGAPEPLQIVCGAPNVAAHQKVVVAPVGATIFPTSGAPLTMKSATIRGIESQGMICAEDEIGLGSSHAGILVLNDDAPVGQKAKNYFKPYEDIIIEIGLTPNRMDAMSHWGVARDVCAYLSHHEGKELKPVFPQLDFSIDNKALAIEVSVENTAACRRYSGVCLSNVVISSSPQWLQQRLKAIGLRPINNIVDITNYIQHETGQPLHAFDYDGIRQKKIIVKTETDGTTFLALDEKERKLSGEDLMICDAEGGMCIAGVFGGLYSGVQEKTRNIFLESAFFDPLYIRKTSIRHNLRTDAAIRFEKGVDISNTVNVLKRAAQMIKEICGGQIASDVIDAYPDPQPKKKLSFSLPFLKKLSGKHYEPAVVKQVLSSLGFSILNENATSFELEVPYHKQDINLPADIVEEVVRIDGLDNIEIPTAITITPAIEKNNKADQLKEKFASYLTGLGFQEILTNSITNSAYFADHQLHHTVKLMNNLSSELDVMRPSMLPSALEVILFNRNRKINNLRLFEFGKTYSNGGSQKYSEQNHLCLYVTGNTTLNSWNIKSRQADIYYLKGLVEALLNLAGVNAVFSVEEGSQYFDKAVTARLDEQLVGAYGQVTQATCSRFDIKQELYYVDLNWDILEKAASAKVLRFKEVARFPTVERDLAIVVPKAMKYSDITSQVEMIGLPKLQEVKLFDVFESEKIGKDKKSMAINFTFLDEEKTLTDKEIDSWMNKIMTSFETELGAEIRK